MTQNTISRIELGTREVTLAEAVAVADVFEVPLTALFTDTPNTVTDLSWQVAELMSVIAGLQDTITALRRQEQ